VAPAGFQTEPDSGTVGIPATVRAYYSNASIILNLVSMKMGMVISGYLIVVAEKTSSV
jgi:hypothetical protein